MMLNPQAIQVIPHTHIEPAPGSVYTWKHAAMLVARLAPYLEHMTGNKLIVPLIHGGVNVQYKSEDHFNRERIGAVYHRTPRSQRQDSIDQDFVYRFASIGDEVLLATGIFWQEVTRAADIMAEDLLDAAFWEVAYDDRRALEKAAANHSTQLTGDDLLHLMPNSPVRKNDVALANWVAPAFQSLMRARSFLDDSHDDICRSLGIGLRRFGGRGAQIR